jgi:hypothetical protein
VIGIVLHDAVKQFVVADTCVKRPVPGIAGRLQYVVVGHALDNGDEVGV